MCVNSNRINYFVSFRNTILYSDKCSRYALSIGINIAAVKYSKHVKKTDVTDNYVITCYNKLILFLTQIFLTTCIISANKGHPIS